MKIYHVPSLQDSNSFLIVDESTKEGAVVDPIEPEKVLEAANSHGVNLKLVLTTHHHGHTKGHISYYVTGKEGEQPAVFTGDTLYAVKNLQFAMTIEPDNLRIQQKLTWAKNQNQAGQPTTPSTIEEEMETNPFMRVHLPKIQEKVGCKSPIEALRELRKLKDKWMMMG
ncbi:hypothetical protein V8G54_005268 [Vigna mungo]|uniref:Hydroxyacylglutathione hydrolase C-terminal domain-containing protein n=1 Tax=Vigna mungo TaxID=3915 RepID=A0AAQ3NZE3_VIGMU